MVGPQRAAWRTVHRGSTCSMAAVGARRRVSSIDPPKRILLHSYRPAWIARYRRCHRSGICHGKGCAKSFDRVQSSTPEALRDVLAFHGWALGVLVCLIVAFVRKGSLLEN